MSSRIAMTVLQNSLSQKNQRKKKIKQESWVCMCTLATLKLRQEDYKCKVSMGCIVSETLVQKSVCDIIKSKKKERQVILGKFILG